MVSRVWEEIGNLFSTLREGYIIGDRLKSHFVKVTLEKTIPYL